MIFRRKMMRKLTVILLAAALVCAFSMSASAADVKLSGQYYVKSLYDKNLALSDNDDTKSLSFTHQRLRVQADIAVADGLTLVTRFDALEKVWGSPNWVGTTAAGAYDTTNRLSTGNAAAKTQENIEFERAYVDFNTGIGKFMVGYQNFAAWGTAFGDTNLTRPGVKYIVPIDKFIVIAAVEKGQELGASYADADLDIFDLGALYKLPNGEVGLLWQYIRNAATRLIPAAVQNDAPFTLNAFLPYYKGTFGNLYVEAEGLYAKGKGYPLVDSLGKADKDVEGFAFYAAAKYDLAPFYVGGMFAYVGGDDITTADKVEGGLAYALLYGQTFVPTLMLFNDQFVTWVGPYAANGMSKNQFLDNAYFTYIYAGYKPTPKCEVKVAYAYAKAEQDVVVNQVGKEYGSEVDVVATYNIYNNLQYELGAGYLWVGDYFKGANAAAKIDNDYLIYHKLTLNF